MLKHGLPLALLMLIGSPLSASVNDSEQKGQGAHTYRLNTIAVVRNKPNGEIVDVWDKSTLFTSSEAVGDWIRVTGHFPDGNTWQPSEQVAWVNRHYITPLERRTDEKRSHDGITRYIEVDKSDFELRVIEEREEEKKVLLRTTVAVGMDRCMPKEKGGRCYYTEPGEYHVRWKVHDPKGIEWCIPKSMEKEYPRDVAAGKRCFRGSIGSYALNIGKSYAIHGTSNPASLGKKVSHGCVRAHNQQMAQIYSLMDVGDKVYIVD